MAIEIICPQCNKRFKAFPSEHRKFCSYKCRSIFNAMREERHPGWKGDEVSYDGLHKWISRRFVKPLKCSLCSKEGVKLEWANISGLYKREFSDWMAICRKCHAHYDDYVNKSWDTRKREAFL